MKKELKWYTGKYLTQNSTLQLKSRDMQNGLKDMVQLLIQRDEWVGSKGWKNIYVNRNQRVSLSKRCNSCKLVCTWKSLGIHKSGIDRVEKRNNQFNSNWECQYLTLNMDRTARQKIIKEIEDLNNTINLMRHSRTFCSIAAEYAFFSSAPGTFPWHNRPQNKS